MLALVRISANKISKTGNMYSCIQLSDMKKIKFWENSALKNGYSELSCILFDIVLQKFLKYKQLGTLFMLLNPIVLPKKGNESLPMIKI